MEGAAGLNPPMLDVVDVHVSRGELAVLSGVRFQVERGERVALMGLSGGGKTTMLRAIVALEPFQAGSIRVDGFALGPGALPRESGLRELRRRVGIVFQFHHLFAHLTAIQNVCLAPLHALGTSREEAERRALALLDSLGVASRARALPRELSGGEAQRVAIARALATDPPLLLMDEPTASLDPARRGELGDTLARLTASGRTLLMATHDDDFAYDVATRVIVLANGVVVEEGLPHQVLRHPAHPATQALLQAKGRVTSPPQPYLPGAAAW
jgi:ABC-type polar amino acid transport system ATPase subunit